ncbi:MAG: DPP IV N-terminal domain-containing protein [Actinomycetes bacterium]
MTRTPDSFPRQHARTRRFSLGRPRAVTVAPDGGHLLLLRSRAGDDPVTDLLRVDLPSGRETLLVDAAALGGADELGLPAEERARRERLREQAGGVTAYATDRDVTCAVFTVAGALHTVDVATGEVTREAAPAGAYDPRVDPTGTRIAYVADDGLHVLERGGQPRTLAAEDGVRWGVADFVAAEELQRVRGHWWSPDGTRIAAARVDDRDVPLWHIADPAHPGRPPVEHRYPAAGTTNPDVRLAVFELDGNRRVDVRWDRDEYPYLVEVVWDEDGPLTTVLLTRDQRTRRVATVDLESGTLEDVVVHTDPAWIDVVPGAPRWLPDGRLLDVVDLHEHGPGGSRALVAVTRGVDAPAPLTPVGVQVTGVAAVAPDGTVWCTAHVDDDPTSTHVLAVDPATGGVSTHTAGAGVHATAVRGGVRLVSAATLDGPTTTTVHHPAADAPIVLRSDAEDPLVTPRVRMLELGERRLRAALLLPTGHDPATDGPLPVLLDPYGGPHAQRVVAARDAHTTSQWFADQGHAVLVVDGRGTPGRGPAFERAVHLDLATPVLDDQVDALHALAALEPGLVDLDRVAIRGWSFGGFLAALAVLRRPDVFRAGIAGAPVTDWRLYDTAYTERYLGHPDEQPEAYRVSSLVDGGALVDVAPLPDGRPEPGLLLIHGLADDNVVAAHSLALSGALLAAGRAHGFLPLSGVTHMTPQEVVAENLLLLQRDFLARHLA